MKNSRKLVFTLIIILLVTSININSQTKLSDVKEEVAEMNYIEITIKPIPIAVQCWTFREFTLFEAIEKVEELGVRYLEAYPGQKVMEGSDITMGPGLSDEDMQMIKKKLSDHDITLVNFGVTGFDNTEEAMRVVFDFAKKMGIKVIVTEPQYDDYSLIDKMVKEYDIKVAIHNHPKPNRYWNPELAFNNIQGLDERIGICGDTGHWLRSGINPLEALRLLKGRVTDMHLKDLDDNNEDVPFGSGRANIHDILAELSYQNYTGTISVEHERESEASNPSPSIRKGLDYIKSITP
jgi:sugar phosphate isomerase/epimerase